MVNIEDFKERLEQIRTHYDLSATALADAIGVQRSSISHLLSGRNKPSLDFVLKLVQRFPEVNLYWLLHGTGSFPQARDSSSLRPHSEAAAAPVAASIPPGQGSIEKILVFYRNGRFREYLPSESPTNN